MFVKKIEIFGFKTFAEKTEVELSKGLTAIVGPNGCGKTNITDALMWVLGESNVRNIRARKTTDVIFNGSQKRKALGLAEVSITFDNTCGTLPLSFNEVTVTRRAYRSGESEFYINKSRCRLKDIYELFLDTGIGREAYSTVSQGEIDAVLSAKPEDRRELLEEAAGVKKYRYRRLEALKKLDKTEANLNRVKDIMAELSEQLEPIAIQAEQAKRYLELENKLQEVEVGLLIRDLHRFQNQISAASKTQTEADNVLEKCSAELAELEGQQAAQADVIVRVDQQTEQARQVENSLSVNVQKLEGKMALIQEKLRAAFSVQERAKADIMTLTTQVEELQKRIETTQTEGAHILTAESNATQQVSTASAELDAVTQKLQNEQDFVQERKASYLELARELAAKRTALQNSLERTKQLEESAKRTEHHLQSLHLQKNEAQTQLEDNILVIEKLNDQIDQSTQQSTALLDQRKEMEARVSSLTKEQSDIARESASRSSRLTALSEMAQAHEGFYEGVRAVMNAVKSEKLQGCFAVVADVIGVPKELETAVETALGSSLQDIISDNVEEAKSAIAFLKSERAGRATFLPLDNIRPDNRAVQGNIDKSVGILGIASELLSYDQHYALAIESLLSRCVIVENIDDAVMASRNLNGWNRIVTLEGEVISPSGAVTGGSTKNKRPSLLARKSEMESLAKEVKALEKRQTNLQTEVSELRKEIARLSEEQKQLQSDINQHRIDLTDHKRRVQHDEADAAKLERQIKALQLEIEEGRKLCESEISRSAQLKNELQSVGETNLDIDKAVNQAEERIKLLEEERSKLREVVLQLNVRLAGAAQKSISIKESLNEFQVSFNRAADDLERRKGELQDTQKSFSTLTEEERITKAEHDRQYELLSNARKTLKEKKEARELEINRSSQVESKVKGLMLRKTEASAALHEAELKLARLEVQSSQILERLQTEYEIDPQRALLWRVDDIEVERGVVSEVARIRREMRDMGQVNTGAIQEHERITERWEFLSSQRADLEQAEDQILAAIREIDINTRDLFTNTFATVAANFDIMFQKLFNGGKTELSLTQPNNLLDTGIEITIQPPGKKMQDMSLLSGGERALTAAAFIFALLLAKPSPFVILDEVDAPLDESNVERFSEVLKEFSKRSQFIVITHNRSTMEASDYLYGVTMQEPGVSKLISVRLSGESTENHQHAGAV